MRVQHLIQKATGPSIQCVPTSTCPQSRGTHHSSPIQIIQLASLLNLLPGCFLQRTHQPIDIPLSHLPALRRKKTMDINTKQSREPLRGQRACAISASPFLPATDTQTPWKIHCTGAEGIECLRLAPTKAEACSFPNIGLIRKKLDTIRTPNFSAHQEKNP